MSCEARSQAEFDCHARERTVRQMTDHRLSTRDLVARSDSDEADRTLETQQPADTVDPSATGEQGSGFENAPSDAPLTRDASSDQASDTREAEGSSGSRTQDIRSADTDQKPLFANDQRERFTSRWQEVQGSFVDQPREAVAEADALVADLMQRLAASFSHERERLEAQWDRGDDVSTEDLRVALTRYRSFFERLLSA
jgi:hypothetical protein